MQCTGNFTLFLGGWGAEKTRTEGNVLLKPAVTHWLNCISLIAIAPGAKAARTCFFKLNHTLMKIPGHSCKSRGISGSWDAGQIPVKVTPFYFPRSPCHFNEYSQLFQFQVALQRSWDQLPYPQHPVWFSGILFSLKQSLRSLKIDPCEWWKCPFWETNLKQQLGQMSCRKLQDCIKVLRGENKMYTQNLKTEILGSYCLGCLKLE